MGTQSKGDTFLHFCSLNARSGDFNLLLPWTRRYDPEAIVLEAVNPGLWFLDWRIGTFQNKISNAILMQFSFSEELRAQLYIALC